MCNERSVTADFFKFLPIKPKRFSLFDWHCIKKSRLNVGSDYELNRDRNKESSTGWEQKLYQFLLQKALIFLTLLCSNDVAFFKI